MARRLKTIANWINENSEIYKAEIVQGFCNTDRKIPNTRLRSLGKGRYGNKIIIHNRKTNNIVFIHNSAETYRNNREVEDWVKGHIENEPS